MHPATSAMALKQGIHSQWYATGHGPLNPLVCMATDSWCDAHAECAVTHQAHSQTAHIHSISSDNFSVQYGLLHGMYSGHMVTWPAQEPVIS